jgi:hypothetical protein
MLDKISERGFIIRFGADPRHEPKSVHHNNSSAFARKCIWALRDIGAPEAAEKL